MTLGNAAKAPRPPGRRQDRSPSATWPIQVRLIVWCKARGHQVEPDPAEMAERYGA
jgi:hypothetical protein